VRRPPLRVRTKLIYASDSLGAEALLEARGLWLLYYYAPPAHRKTGPLLTVALAGAVFAVVPLFSSLVNPLVGYWSDRTSSRLGRRLPCSLGATPLWALLGFLAFTPPRHAGQTIIAAYLALTLVLYSFFSNASGGPYQSLMPEIATSNKERLSVNSLVVYCGAAGGAVGLVGSGLIIDRFGFRVMALAIALLAFTCRYVGMAGIWKHVDRSQPPARISLREAFGAALSNRFFRLYLPGFVLFQVGLTMTRAALPYYVKAILGHAKTGTWVSILTAILITTFVLCIPVQSRLARRSSKRQAFRRAMLGAVAVFPLLALVGLIPDVPSTVQIIAVMVLAGLPVAGVYLFPSTLTADIIDYDSLTTGYRREATYYQLHSFVEQISTAFAPALLAGLLLIGDTAAHPLGIRLVGPAAGLLILVGYLVFRRYELPDDVLEHVESIPVPS